MDFSMYSMLTKSDAAHTLPERMKGGLMFSKDELNDTWLSDMLCNRMTQAQSLDFRKRWIAHCKESGVTSAWISIDGSNNDCAAKACSLTEPGKAKSHTDSDIISYMYAVNAQTGMPITYMETSAEELRWNVRHIVNEDSLFGMASWEKCRIFGSKDTEAYLSFFYDGTNGTERSTTLIRKVMRERKRLNERISEGKPAIVSESLARYLCVEEKDGVLTVSCDYDNWQASLNAKGFYSIATSQCLSAAETDALYGLRDASETQYMFSKSQLGFDVTRNHYENSIENKFLLCFVSSILRSKVQNACKSLHYGTNRMLMEMDRISLCLVEGDVYIAIHDESKRQKELLAAVGIVPADMDAIAEE